MVKHPAAVGAPLLRWRAFAPLPGYAGQRDTATPAIRFLATSTMPQPLVYPSILRRLAAMLYEALVVTGIIMVAGFLFYGATTRTLEGGARLAFQLYLVALLGAYFVWCWHRGRTLPMKAWKLQLRTPDGQPVSLTRAAGRFVLGALSLGAGALGALTLWKTSSMPAAWLAVAAGVLTICWALIDPERQFLHDRLAGTRLVLESDTASRSSNAPTRSSPKP